MKKEQLEVGQWYYYTVGYEDPRQLYYFHILTKDEGGTLIQWYHIDHKHKGTIFWNYGTWKEDPGYKTFKLIEPPTLILIKYNDFKDFLRTMPLRKVNGRRQATVWYDQVR